MHRSSSLGITLVSLLALVGCDTGASDLGDASVDAGAIGPAVAAPRWDACPAGWARDERDGVATCTPPVRLACTGATFQPVGASACEPVDDACSEGRFREARDPERTYVFVDPSAGAGGDGSEAAPFASIDAAIASGATSLLLSEGDHTIGATVPDGLELRGVCADRARLLAPAGRMAILVAPGQSAALVGLTVSGTGIGPAARGTLTLDRVVLDAGLEGWGAGFNGGTLVASRLLVRAPVASTRASGVGVGLSLIARSTATLTDVVIEDAHGVGIDVEGSRVEGERVVVQRTRPEASGMHGGGVSVVDEGSLTLRDALVADVFDFGITVQSGSTSSLTRTRIDGVSIAEGDRSGRGLEAWNASVTVDDVDITGASSVGLYVHGHGEARGSDLTVRDTRATEEFGAGVLVEGRLELERALFADVTFAGLAVSGGQANVVDLTIARVATGNGFGAALMCTDAASCVVDRFGFERLHTLGVVAFGSGTTLTLANGSVRHVEVEPRFDVGRAIEVDTGARATLRAIAISDVVESAVVAFSRDDAGALVEGTSIEMTDVTISDIAERACASSTCATEAGGTGVAALAGAAITARALHVVGAPLCGVQVYDAASLDVSMGTIEGSAIGACVQIDGYDLARVVEDVRYLDNDRNVESVSVYVPSRTPLP